MPSGRSSRINSNPLLRVAAAYALSELRKLPAAAPTGRCFFQHEPSSSGSDTPGVAIPARRGQLPPTMVSGGPRKDVADSDKKRAVNRAGAGDGITLKIGDDVSGHLIRAEN